MRQVLDDYFYPDATETSTTCANNINNAKSKYTIEKNKTIKNTAQIVNSGSSNNSSNNSRWISAMSKLLKVIRLEIT